MAGSIFKKLRGLLAKFWAKLQIVLHYYGLRVDYQEIEGLFNIFARPKGYWLFWSTGSRSYGADRNGSRSNLTHPRQIGRLRSKGARERRRNSPEQSSRGGAAPEFTNPALRGSVWAGVGSRSIGVIRVTHLCTRVGGLGLGRGSWRCRAALARRRVALTRFRPQLGLCLSLGCCA